jgi:hypothetical protein
MIIEFSLNPNCSESVYRFKKEDISKLPYSFDSIEKILMMCGGASIEAVSGYSSLRPENEDQICIYFYQTACPELESVLINAEIDYKAEKPFTDSILTAKENLFE